MSVTASCGHTLAEDESEGPDGLGWRLAVRDYSREGGPAVRYGSYCTACRDKALAEPDYVLADDAAELAWLRGEAGAPMQPAAAADENAEPASYGVWSVWDGNPRNDDEEGEARHVGTYRGFVDVIALEVAWSDRNVAYFRRELDTAAAEDIPAPADTSELPECVGLNILQDKGMLTDERLAIEPFFAGRPVFVRYSEWGDCVSLFPATGEAGARYLREQSELRAVLAKLTTADIAILQRHGLKT